jgi:hypothetical protein
MLNFDEFHCTISCVTHAGQHTYRLSDAAMHTRLAMHLDGLYYAEFLLCMVGPTKGYDLHGRENKSLQLRELSNPMRKLSSTIPSFITLYSNTLTCPHNMYQS